MNMRMVVGSVVIVGAFGALLVSGTQGGTMQAVPVSQLRGADATTHSYAGQRLRAVGFVTRDPVRKMPRKTDAGIVNVNLFAISDKGAIVKVRYADALPDTFRLGGPVQVDGVYTKAGELDADRVLTKCPSKYDAEAQAQTKKKPSAASD